jgi:O-antigen/teichoic acid export membrane protein
MLGTLIGQLILLLALPLLTRLYPPADYGVLATYSAWVLILSAVVTLRLEFAILLPEDDTEAEQTTTVGVLITVCLSAIAGLLLWALATILHLGLLKAIKPWVVLLTIGTVLNAISWLFTLRLTRQRRFQLQAHSRWVQSLVYVLAQLVGGFLRLGTFGLIGGQLLGQLASVGMLGWRWRPVRVSWRTVGSTVRRYWQFPVYNAPTSLLQTLSQQLPLLLTVSFYSLKEAGWLALGMRLIAAPIDLLGVSVGHVYLGRAAEYSRRSSTELRQLMWRTMRLMFTIGILPTLLLMAFAPTLFEWVFGARWRPTGEYLQILAPVLLCWLIIVPAVQTLVVIQRLHVQLWWESIRLLLTITTFWLSARMQQPFWVALVGYTMSYMASVAFLLGMTLRSIRNYALNTVWQEGPYPVANKEC